MTSDATLRTLRLVERATDGAPVRVIHLPTVEIDRLHDAGLIEPCPEIGMRITDRGRAALNNSRMSNGQTA